MKKLTILKKLNPALLKDIEKFESKNNFTFPNSFKNSLLESNLISVKECILNKGGKSYQVDIFFPFDENYKLSIQLIHKYFYDFFKNDFIAFANDPGGWKYVISLRKNDYGKVYFCRIDTELDDAITLLADDFNEFIDSLEKYESPSSDKCDFQK